MTTTPNPHTIVMAADRRSFTCAAEGCRYLATWYDFPGRSQEQLNVTAEATFRADHSGQYEPGRAPDITVEWQLVADCSVCEDGGRIFQDDSETVECKDCGTTWYMDGSGGEKEKEDD